MSFPLKISDGANLLIEKIDVIHTMVIYMLYIQWSYMCYTYNGHIYVIHTMVIYMLYIHWSYICYTYIGHIDVIHTLVIYMLYIH